MIKLLIIFFFAIIFNQNFSYSEDDWITITSPKKINSISYANDDIFIGSVNGLFGYDAFNKNFYFVDDVGDLNNNEIFIVYHDSYRDQLWILNKDTIYFKTINSNIWRELDTYLYLNILNNNSILNIGSNHENIYIETRDKILKLNPYSGNLISSELKNDFFVSNIKWSSTTRSSLSDYVDLTRFFSTDSWSVINRNTLEHKGREIQITCVKEVDNSMVLIGTDSGELFFADSHLNQIEKISSIPSTSNIKVAYPDPFGEWWFSDNDWFYLDREFRYDREVIFLLHWKEETNTWTEYYQNEYPGILSKDINKIIRKDHFLYIATNYGLLTFNIMNSRWRLYDTRNGLSDNKIIDLCIHKDFIYLGTSSGLDIFSHITNKSLGYYSRSILNNTAIFDIELNLDNLFVLSANGFYSINLKINNFELLSQKSFSKISIYNDSIILLFQNKVYKYYDNEFIFLFKDKNIKNINHIDQYVWIHNDENVLLYDIKNDNKYRYNYLDGIPGNIIYNLNCNENWICFNTNNGITFYNWRKFHN